MKVNSVSDQMGCLKLGDLTCIHGQQNLADSAAQRRVLTVERPDQAVPGARVAALSRQHARQDLRLKQQFRPEPRQFVPDRGAEIRVTQAGHCDIQIIFGPVQVQPGTADVRLADHGCKGMPRGAGLRPWRSRIAGTACQLLPLTERSGG